MFFIGSFQVTLPFEFFSSNSIGFISMDFGSAKTAIRELDRSSSLHLPPAPLAVQFSKTWQITDGFPNGDPFDVDDIADDLKGCHILVFLSI